MSKPDTRPVQQFDPGQHHVLRSRLGSSETPHRFMGYLRRLAKHDLAELKRSLGKNPQRATPYIEPFASEE